MLDKVLNQIAERVLDLDEASLTQLLPYFKQKMESFEPNREWEKSVIIFFLINSVRVKNTIFNDHIAKGKTKKTKDSKDSPLKLVK